MGCLQSRTPSAPTRRRAWGPSPPGGAGRARPPPPQDPPTRRPRPGQGDPPGCTPAQAGRGAGRQPW
eukprot:6622188-Alexandrium_andersonii.AAC.1